MLRCVSHRCLVEGAEEFIIEPINMADVKRLRGHTRPVHITLDTSLGTASENSGSTCGSKRKMVEPTEPSEGNSPERKLRLSEGSVL